MRPPRLASWLLERALPVDSRGAALGDLEEEFRARCRAGTNARLWYWRQVLSSLPQAWRLRLPRAGSIGVDLAYTLRLWRRHPAFAFAAITTQTIGVAVTTAVLAVTYAVLLRPLPYAEPERIIHLSEMQTRSGSLSFQDLVDIRRLNRSLERVAGFTGGSRTLTTPGASPERLPMVAVTDGFFEVLGVPPLLGRSFTPADMVRGAAPVAILSHEAWQRRFGSDRAIVGRLLVLGGTPHEIIGVLPSSFAFPLRGRPDLWLPLRPSVQQEERGYMHWLDAVARPRPGITAAQLQADLASVGEVVSARDPKNHGNVRFTSVSLRDMIVSGVRPTIHALLAGVALVMLVTCATTATLLLSRGAARRAELSVRSALGASRGRIVRQLLTENLLLSLAGGCAGTVAGHWLLRAFALRMPLQQRVLLPHFEEPGVGVIVALTAVAIAVATGVLFGILPAWRAARSDGGATLKSGRVTAGTSETRVRSVLVSLQVAVALVLLAGAALLATSVHRLLQVPAGFDPDGLVTMRLNLPPRYGPDAVRAFQRQLLPALQAAPGVIGAALIDLAPLTGSGNNGDLQVVGRVHEPGDRAPVVTLRTVSYGYFATVRVPLLRGRGFAPSDTTDTPRVVMINRLLADSVFAGSDPVGQRVKFQFVPAELTIVGVVDNERFDEIDRPILPVVYFPAEQDAMSSFTIVVRGLDTGMAVAAGRQIVGRLDPDLPIFGVRTVEQVRAESPAVFLRRATLWMLGVFAVASILLAGMGLYGVLAQTVGDRTREIGVRVALGASPARVVGLVARDAVAAAGTGIVAGIAATLAASRWLSSLLFGVGAQDPLTIAGATAFLAVIALLACVVPTRRALGIDPASAVRD
jgi:putative ABC transport system permease protein